MILYSVNCGNYYRSGEHGPSMGSAWHVRLPFGDSFRFFTSSDNALCALNRICHYAWLLQEATSSQMKKRAKREQRNCDVGEVHSHDLTIRLE